MVVFLTGLRRGFYTALPQHALSRLGGWTARHRGGPFTTGFIRWFIRRYGVNMAEAAEPDPRAYRSFNAFFTRALGAGARPQPVNSATVASPVDGVVSACGPIEADTLIQAKGIGYSTMALLGSEEAAARYRNGSFLTLYLRPCDYHRVHVPFAGDLQCIRHIRGRLWPVRPWAVEGIPGLFTRNERVTLEFDSDAGRYELVMVGALMVGGLETIVTGPVRRGRLEPRIWNLEATPRRFERGDEIGRFNFGSTVILLFPPGSIRLDPSFAPGTELHLGQALDHTE
ncbi:MAG: archaetidylserine decarboxylase [Gammaproteobacteria bacterium]